MRRFLRPGLTTAGTVLVLAAGGGMWAYAGWISRSTSETFTVRATQIPQMEPPTVALTVVPVIRWEPVEIPPATPVHQYVVSRHGAGAATVVCAPRATESRCLDLTAPPGDTVTYTVRARYGTHWVGTDSDPSSTLTLPGGSAAQPTPRASGTPAPATTAATPLPRSTSTPTPDPDVPYGLPDAVPSVSAEPAPSVLPSSSVPPPLEQTVSPPPRQLPGIRAGSNRPE